VAHGIFSIHGFTGTPKQNPEFVMQKEDFPALGGSTTHREFFFAISHLIYIDNNSLRFCD
jgi:hypothetical protein